MHRGSQIISESCQHPVTFISLDLMIVGKRCALQPDTITFVSMILLSAIQLKCYSLILLLLKLSANAGYQ